ncbi:MAG: S-methyl-5'-thioadenosine phosphorylase [Candidatus Methanofastidiosum methylothiophilum]|uniref:Purine nucleoside phosphorylase n=1 Tax=Candidatus Methanofastidiosum methylothiophilum TaxID=1705564 RepID=A0A150J2N6_9EURY|nr:MAG: S-methyl-5'-thioadenosine phosphorylase [Candidatus Methanofastidiosum methylthiophilus]
MTKIGIIGGSGLDDPNFLKDYEELTIKTKYGKPSSSIVTGTIKGVEVAILARHGRNHSIHPSGVNYRANVWSLKEIDCTHIIATTAVGSLRDEIHPGHLVFPDQFIDFTKKREYTFFDEEKVIHTPMADPFSEILRNLLIDSSKKLGLKYHPKGTVVTIEGPRFSTRAESNMFRMIGADVINMSTVPEVSLAKELEIEYASVAMSTDYDCWKENEESVTFEMVMETMRKNAENVKKLIVETIPKI